jgi:hypothetical protein
MRRILITVLATGALLAPGSAALAETYPTNNGVGNCGFDSRVGLPVGAGGFSDFARYGCAPDGPPEGGPIG